jgi:hypothetical protein
LKLFGLLYWQAQPQLIHNHLLRLLKKKKTDAATVES